MKMSELLASGGGALLIAMTLLQISPIKINPWSAIAKAIGRAINGDVIQKLDAVETAQVATRGALDHHIADGNRARILSFNTELLRDIPHTQEDYIDILLCIDAYEKYCKAHPEYQNNRATHAIANISRVYDERLQKRDFL